MKAKTCDNCNSEIIIVKKGKSHVAECSYCGSPADVQVGVDYTDEYKEED